jgi:uncharacterized protein
MEQQLFFALQLLPPRPSFALDMTSEERMVMHKHALYWADLMNRGFVVVYGPVMDPRGPYGLGIVKVSDEEQVKTFIENDPANGLNSYVYYPMRAIIPAKTNS